MVHRARSGTFILRLFSEFSKGSIKQRYTIFFMNVESTSAVQEVIIYGIYNGCFLNLSFLKSNFNISVYHQFISTRSCQPYNELTDNKFFIITDARILLRVPRTGCTEDTLSTSDFHINMCSWK